jgi:hypothetical protein
MNFRLPIFDFGFQEKILNPKNFIFLLATVILASVRPLL